MENLHFYKALEHWFLTKAGGVKKFPGVASSYNVICSTTWKVFERVHVPSKRYASGNFMLKVVI